MIRPEAGAPGISGLYFYSDKMGIRQAETKLMEILRREDPDLRVREVFLDRPYQSERDAMQLLNQLGKLYEPIRLPWRKKKGADIK